MHNARSDVPHAVRPVGADVEHDEADPSELALLARLEGHVHHAQARGRRPGVYVEEVGVADEYGWSLGV